ncbi:heme exporter protein CcmD [Yoonia sp.]|nr:heme exporter protein CcmD [Yoonia sp.]
MPDLGQYANAVLAAYGVSIVLLVVLVGLSWWRSARVRAALERVEKNG